MSLHQNPSPYNHESMEFFNGGTKNYDKLLGFMENINEVLFQIKQQQATTINSLNVLTHDVMNINEELQTFKSQSTRGTGGRTRGANRGNQRARGGRGRGARK